MTDRGSYVTRLITMLCNWHGGDINPSIQINPDFRSALFRSLMYFTLVQLQNWFYCLQVHPYKQQPDVEHGERIPGCDLFLCRPSRNFYCRLLRLWWHRHIRLRTRTSGWPKFWRQGNYWVISQQSCCAYFTKTKNNFGLLTSVCT